MSGPSGEGDAVERTVAHLRAVLADGPDAWIVGGAVRERLRGRATDDVDVAIAGDADAARRTTRALARRAGGHAFPLSDAFGAWRATGRADDAAAWQVDVTPLQGDHLHDDLRRRDFTVNALAEPVAGGPLVDLFGGERDLAEGRLRLVAPDAIARDPVRALRLARFAAELGAAPDAAATAAARAAAAALSRVPGERMLPELARALAGPGWERGLEVLIATGALAALLPAAAPDDDGPRPAVLDALRAVLDAPVVPEATDDDARAIAAHAAPTDRRVLLALSALLCDAPDPQAALAVLRPSRELRTGVTRVVRALRALRTLPATATSPAELHAALGPAATDGPEAVLLARALRPDPALPWAALAARAVRWAAGPPTSPVSGDVLARALDLRPGPELGRLLSALAIAADAGEVADADGAVALARTLRSAAPGRGDDAG